MENLKLDDFTKFKYVSVPKFSPDGKKVCFIVKVADAEENKYKSNLWLYRVDEDKYFQLTSFDEESSFIWKDDSENILFSGTRDKKDKEKLKEGEEFTQFYKININGGEAIPEFRIPRIVQQIKIIDEKNYVFTSPYDFNKPDLNKLSDEEKAKEKKRLKEEKDYEVMDEIPFWSNGKGFTNKKRIRLYLYNTEKNDVEQLTEGYLTISGFELNEARDKAIFSGVEFKDKLPNINDIYIYDLKEKKLNKISPYENFNYAAPRFLDDELIFFAGSDMKKHGLNENPKIYTLNLKSKEAKCIIPDLDLSIWNSVGTDSRLGKMPFTFKVDDGYFYFRTTETESSYLNRVDKNGNLEKVIETKGGTVDDCDIKKGKIVFTAMRDLNLNDLFIMDGGKEKQITDFNREFFKDKKLSKPERISAETDKGVQIDGWIIKPVDFDSNKKYPAILDIHGGPKTVYGEIYYHEMQYWANSGYVVFFCNPRGSDGKGDDFADIRGKYGTVDYEDLMKFTDYVLDNNDYIDKDRLGVTGGSYGGFMTNWIIGHTDRFKAAAAQRSIANWISKFNTTDIGYYFTYDQAGNVTPWSDMEKVWFHSPLKYADKVKTPTLFIHAEEDYRCWLPEGIQMFTALKYFGIEARLCMFRGENHELSRGGKPKHRIRRLKELTDWFDKHLKDNTNN
ncbi:MAG: alpha/beta hydrolase family protein [Spirochaetota bacterium]